MWVLAMFWGASFLGVLGMLWHASQEHAPKLTILQGGSRRAWGARRRTIPHPPRKAA